MSTADTASHKDAAKAAPSHKKMLVTSDPYETRIAILEDDRLTELFIERHQHLGAVGNIYRGRVSRVLPGMQAAFVDIGLDRDAFLYVDEIVAPLSPYEDADRVAREESDAESANDDSALKPSIDQLLKQGQELTVQVIKDALPNKGARVSTQISLPGRKLVLLPNVPHLGISRKIVDEDERERLRSLIAELEPTTGGMIVRTAGFGVELPELNRDLAYLERLWRQITDRALRMTAPSLVHRDLDLILRVIRDSLSEQYSVIWVDEADTYERIVDFVDQIDPQALGVVKLSQHGSALFERFGIDDEIEAALKTKVWLKSGGHIVIHPTEALVAIDVNTGRFVGRSNLEDTILTTNLEAVREIVRQVRLRNLGGIIVIDLIDMSDEGNAQRVFQALATELAKDRAKNKVLNISEFGLVEITRKRNRPNLERQLTQPCPYCCGAGRIKSVTTICLEIRRQILRSRSAYSGRDVLLRVHPDVANALQNHQSAILLELEDELSSTVILQSDAELHHERFDILEA